MCFEKKTEGKFFSMLSLVRQVGFLPMRISGFVFPA